MEEMVFKKMIKIYSHNIISPLGWSSEDNYQSVINGKTGIELHQNSQLSGTPLQASIIKDEEIKNAIANKPELKPYTKLEQLCICSIQKVIKNIDATDTKTGFIFSTTKGNVEKLEKKDTITDALLALTAQKITNYFGFVNKPYVVSNACISGLAAFILAKRLIDADIYNKVIILGADVLSKFIVSGFQSFQSLSYKPCKPFDKNRDGLTLGEAVGTIVIGKTNEIKQGEVEIVNGAISNDANHISGPSRTGEGLFRAINKTLNKTDKIDVICAHGTATPFNDDMESHAISRASLEEVPVNGLKAYFGHTLGAAGVIESIISILAMQNNVIIGTKGLTEKGLACSINIAMQTEKKEYSNLLKLMSGFGGCNAAVHFKKQV